MAEREELLHNQEKKITEESLELYQELNHSKWVSKKRLKP